ncbi:hypothetical protein SAMN05421823_10261 [Catalinimonas alkaloidigena]|uniref:FAD dependent oxidoreductase domain-containing protein n=1 Tax=Catalinimonas alkaloidigena TaxID=1075417 RepID=A0A1G8ZQR9_9BACT|nr:FAD-dependent oxidoreductase [Catalinimonas alkaloidigena]SDK17452.1 hypothetical protein SAMN05421823_10261 [Catalinimonas alkaloidigena]
MLSFWETHTYLSTDFLIVGGGISGLSTALRLKERRPNAQVTVLERGTLPNGASTKNAGFACFGSLTELLEDIDTIGPAETLALVERRYRGLQRLRARVGDAALDYQGNGGWELIGEWEEGALSRLEEVNESLSPLFQEPVFQVKTEARARLGFASEAVRHLIFNPYEGQLHPGQMMRALWQRAVEQGVTVLHGCDVRSWEEANAQVTVTAALTGHPEPVKFSAAQLAFCTNAFTPALLPELSLRPGRGQVLVTEPLGTLPFKGVFHFDKGYYYFRNFEGRVLFGGGRNLDFAGEETTAFEINERIYEDLLHKLRTVILPGHPVKIAQRWAGIMAFGEDKRPIVRRLGTRTVAGVRLGGMGVAIGSLIGDELADLLLA